MRYTHTRELVYEFLEKNKGNTFTAYEIAEALKMNHVTVYRILDFLLTHKLVHHIATLGKWTVCSHQKNSQDHNFLVCRKCHGVQEYLSPHQCTNHLGFHCEEHIIEIVGKCRTCITH